MKVYTAFMKKDAIHSKEIKASPLSWWDKLPNLIGGILILQGVYWIAVICYFHGAGDANQHWANAGTFGDMFGGLTCLFSGFAFAGLIVTIRQQSREIRLQIDEQRRTRDEFEAQTRQFKAQNRLSYLQSRCDDIYRRLEMISALEREVKYTRRRHVITREGHVIKQLEPISYVGVDALRAIQFGIIDVMKILLSNDISRGDKQRLLIMRQDLFSAYFSIKTLKSSIDCLIKDVSEYFIGELDYKMRFDKIILSALSDGTKEIICMLRGDDDTAAYIDMVVVAGYITLSDVSPYALDKKKCKLFTAFLSNQTSIDEFFKECRTELEECKNGVKMS